MSELEAALARIPLLAGATGLTTTRLAGLTNVNHLVSVGDDRYVLRVPGEGTGEYINRVNEEVAARSAASATESAPEQRLMRIEIQASRKLRVIQIEDFEPNESSST